MGFYVPSCHENLLKPFPPLQIFLPPPCPNRPTVRPSDHACPAIISLPHLLPFPPLFESVPRIYLPPPPPPPMLMMLRSYSLLPSFGGYPKISLPFKATPPPNQEAGGLPKYARNSRKTRLLRSRKRAERIAHGGRISERRPSDFGLRSRTCVRVCTASIQW